MKHPRLNLKMKQLHKQGQMSLDFNNEFNFQREFSRALSPHNKIKSKINFQILQMRNHQKSPMKGKRNKYSKKSLLNCNSLKCYRSEKEDITKHLHRKTKNQL